MASITETIALTKSSILATEGAAKDPLSTRVGNYQFTANRWLEIQYDIDPGQFGSYNAISVASDATLRDTILNLRLDPTETEQAMDYVMAQSVTDLQTATLPVTPGALYACYIFGTGPGVDLYAANPDTKADQVLSRNLINRARGYVIQPDGTVKTVAQLQDTLEKFASVANNASTAYTKSKQVTSSKGVQGLGMSSLEAMVMTGLMQQKGIGANQQLMLNINLLESTQITGKITRAFLQAAGALDGTVNNELTASDADAKRAVMITLSKLGSTSLSSLTGVVPATLTSLYDDKLSENVKDITQPLDALVSNTMTWPNVMQQSAYQGGLSGMLRTITVNTTGAGNTGNFIHTMNVCNSLNKLTNNIIAATSEAQGQSFGTGPGGLGSNIRNMNDVITFGASAITRDMQGASRNLVDMGTWSMDNLYRLQTPGSVVRQMIQQGLADKLDLTNKLINNQVPLGDLENPSYDSVIQDILSGITNSTQINAVTTAFNMYVKISNLGQLTDITYLLPILVQSTGYNTFSDLGKHMVSLGMNKVTTFQKLGYLLSQIDPGLDLNHISQLESPIHKPSADFAVNHYGFGGGVFGELTMADFIGTAAGYIHNDSLPYIINANKSLVELPEGLELALRAGHLLKLILGNYTSGGNYTVPGLGTYTDITDAINAVCASIEQQLLVVAALTGGIQTVVAASDKAHTASYSQILKENLHMTKMNISLFDGRGTGPQSLVAFANSLSNYAQDNGYGQIGEYLERVSTNDLYGDAIRAILKQGRNAQILQDLGIDTNKFKLPQSKYYTDPTGMYIQAYSGDLPLVPENMQDPLMPLTDADAYLEKRNKVLSTNGYNAYTMNAAAADEAYMDITGGQIPFQVREQMGLNVLRQTLLRNMSLRGNQLMLTDPQGKVISLGEVTASGVNLTNKADMISILVILCNKTIYGNLGTTKGTNPYLTDQMVYGMAEMLSMVNPSNLEKLKNTVLGKGALIDLLTDIKSLINTITGSLDTSMDRNDPVVWGDSGPAAQIYFDKS